MLLSPLRKRGTKLEFPSPKEAMCQVWLKLAHWVLKKKISKFCQCIFTISILSPLGKGCFWTTLNLLHPKKCFVPSLVEIDPVGHCISSLLHLSLLRIGCGPSFEQTWILFTQGYALCQTELKLAPSVWKFSVLLLVLF